MQVLRQCANILFWLDLLWTAAAISIMMMMMWLISDEILQGRDIINAESLLSWFISFGGLIDVREESDRGWGSKKAKTRGVLGRMEKALCCGMPKKVCLK